MRYILLILIFISCKKENNFYVNGIYVNDKAALIIHDNNVNLLDTEYRKIITYSLKPLYCPNDTTFKLREYQLIFLGTTNYKKVSYSFLYPENEYGITVFSCFANDNKNVWINNTLFKKANKQVSDSIYKSYNFCNLIADGFKIEE